MSELPKTRLNMSRMGTFMSNQTSVESIHPYYGYTGIILSMFFFQIVYKLVSVCRAPKAMSSQSDLSRWRNLLVSWIHAVIISLWDITALAWYPDMLYDLINSTNWFTYCMVAFSTGYFFFDFVDIILTGRLLRCWEVSIHHICVGGMFMFNLVSGRCIAYNAVALISEFNTVFLHLRKLLQMAQVDFDHWAYRINVFANLITFAVFRFAALGAIFYGCLFWANLVPAFYYCSICASLFCMVPINIVLFWRLFRNDILRNYFPNLIKRKQTSCGDTLTNSNNNLKESNHFVHNNHIKRE